MQNTNNEFANLDSILMKQIEKLSVANQTNLDQEIKRSQTIAQVGTVLVNAAKVRLDATKVRLLADRRNGKEKALPGSKRS